ncbi:unannotated protein [freshwater metagenome]|uniref:Unannotated protein n=1 Tax=freshwater metagenome TaxID=449393 RepID=A0A6J7I1V0_9ZZZZ|nr:hypothetical protein [Actinomycetota bacterium]
MSDATRTVLRSTVVDAPVDAVWAVIRDFGDWSWFPAVESNVLLADGRGDRPQSVRDLNGGAAHERLLGLDDDAHVITYTLDTAVWPPVRNYLAQISLHRVTDGDCAFIHWTATFDTDAAEADQVAAAVGSAVYEAALEGLRARLAATTGREAS